MLVLANKQDLPDAMSAKEVERALVQLAWIGRKPHTKTSSEVIELRDFRYLAAGCGQNIHFEAVEVKGFQTLNVFSFYG